MDKEAFDTKVKEIGEMETVEEMRAGLAELHNGVSEIYDTNATLSEQHENDVKEIKNDVKLLANKPAQRWEGIVDKILFGVVGAVVGYIMIKLGF
mgnify:CR=1 FL=1